MSRLKLAELDLISCRYGVLPSYLLDIDVEHYQFNLLVARIGMEEEVKAQKKSIAKSESGRSRRHG